MRKIASSYFLNFLVKRLKFTKKTVLFFLKKYFEEPQPRILDGTVQYSGPVFKNNEIYAAIETLLEEWYIFGPKCRQFEKEFSHKLGCDYGIFTNSGSSANLLMVSALRTNTVRKHKPKLYLEKGAKVITPVSCFPTTLNPIIQNGLTPVFVDVTLPSGNLDLDQVEEVLSKEEGIRAIMFAHPLGVPPDMDRLMSLVHKHDLIFLEDCCDALGGTWRDRKLGSFGVMSTCSFFPAHHMTTIEGGYVATNDPVLVSALRSIRDWGRDCVCNEIKPGNVSGGTACGQRFKNWLPGAKDMVYDHRYVFREMGYNLKPIEIQGAIGLKQLNNLGYLEDGRRKNFDYLYELFKPFEKYFYMPEALNGAKPMWFSFLLTVKEGAPFTRDEFVSYLEKNGIQTRPLFSGNILAHPAYYDTLWNVDGETRKLEDVFPNANKILRSAFFLGTYAGLTDRDRKKIARAVEGFFKEKGL